MAAKNLGVNAKEILVFEDSVVGATAASEAHMDLVVIGRGDSPEAAYPKEVKMFLNTFSDLIGRLDTNIKEDIQIAAKDYEANMKEEEGNKAS